MITVLTTTNHDKEDDDDDDDVGDDNGDDDDEVGYCHHDTKRSGSGKTSEHTCGKLYVLIFSERCAVPICKQRCVSAVLQFVLPYLVISSFVLCCVAVSCYQ